MRDRIADSTLGKVVTPQLSSGPLASRQTYAKTFNRSLHFDIALVVCLSANEIQVHDRTTQDNAVPRLS